MLVMRDLYINVLVGMDLYINIVYRDNFSIVLMRFLTDATFFLTTGLHYFLGETLTFAERGSRL